MARPLATDQDQPTTFIELFFDLVFVFAVTQLVDIVHHHISWSEVAHGLVIFWLVWWAWTQFTWALNSADTTHPAVEVSVLAATAVVFAMAVAIPTSLTTNGLWFAAAYIVVRSIGLGVYAAVAWEHPDKRAPLRRFVVLSIPGLATVLVGGLVSSEFRPWVWAAVVVLDVLAAALAGTAEGWDIRSEHFGERHGLFVIIALGESLIVAAAGLSSDGRTTETLVVGAFAVITTCALWWTYFTAAKPALDARVAAIDGHDRTVVARDVYSILHFPIIFGIVLLAVVFEEAILHPSVSLPIGADLALVAGVFLFIGGAGAALRRAALPTRPGWVIGLLVAGATVALTQPLSAPWTLAGVAAGASLAAALSQRNFLARRE
jgi:low temperature requirement protein LtrA